MEMSVETDVRVKKPCRKKSVFVNVRERSNLKKSVERLQLWRSLNRPAPNEL